MVWNRYNLIFSAPQIELYLTFMLYQSHQFHSLSVSQKKKRKASVSFSLSEQMMLTSKNKTGIDGFVLPLTVWSSSPPSLFSHSLSSLCFLVIYYFLFISPPLIIWNISVSIVWLCVFVHLQVGVCPDLCEGTSAWSCERGTNRGGEFLTGLK